MVAVNVSFPSFSSGELSPKMRGRHDIAAYYSGLRRCENFTVDSVGPAKFRTGTIFADNTPGNEEAALFTFEFTDGNSYILEFTDLKLRFYRNNGIVMSGGAAYEVATPYTSSQIFQLKFAQQNNVLYIAHPSHNPRTLTYSGPTSWAIASHSPTGISFSASNYPAAVGLYEQRLVYGGMDSGPNTLYFSKAANFNNFTVGTQPDDGIQYTIAGPAIRISWMRGTNKFLAVGTQGDVYQVTGGIDGVVTPTSISIRPSNSYGVLDINPIGRGTQVFFMQNNALVLRSFEYNLQVDSYVPVDRNTISDHITQSGIKQISFQDGRPNIIWAVRNDGQLAGMTIEDNESVSGWHRHTTDGKIISVATLPRSGKHDQLWVCVLREINGQSVYSVEFFADEPTYPNRADYFTDFNSKDADERRYNNVLFEAQKQYIHIDSAASYYGDLVASVSVTPSAVSGEGVTFTASASFFTSGMVGREIWRKSIDGSEEGRARIDAYISGTEVACTILETFDSTNLIPSGEWYLTSRTLSGLDHLEGREVRICADGGQHEPLVVSGGQIVLSRQASVVHVGLGYDGWIETMDLEGGGMNGPAQTKKKALHKIGFRFMDTLYCRYGTDYYKLQQMEFRVASMRMDRPPILFSGDIVETFVNDTVNNYDAGWARAKVAIVCQDQPFPCTIQLLVPYFNVSN